MKNKAKRNILKSIYSKGLLVSSKHLFHDFHTNNLIDYIPNPSYYLPTLVIIFFNLIGINTILNNDELKTCITF